MLIKSACLLFAMILFLCNFLIQNILALEEDEFYCKSKSETYKNACKKCINEENCNYGKFKSCQCIDLELFNSDTGEFVGGIDIVDDTAQCKSSSSGRKYCYVDYKYTTCSDIVASSFAKRLAEPADSRWLPEVYVSFEACEQNKTNKIGNELFLEGFRLTSKDLPKESGGGGFGDIPPTSDLCEFECTIRKTEDLNIEKCSFNPRTKICLPYDWDGNALTNEGFTPGKASPEACQTECARRSGKCGSWSFDAINNLCYLHDSDGCCKQLTKRVPDENFISGYICPNCWSTRNDCKHCPKHEREVCFDCPDFCAGCEPPNRASSTAFLGQIVRRSNRPSLGRRCQRQGMVLKLHRYPPKRFGCFPRS